MRIEIRLFATLRKYAKGRDYKFHIDVPEGSKILDVLSSLEIPEDKYKLVLLNGISSKLDKIVSENDVLSIFPPIAGG